MAEHDRIGCRRRHEDRSDVLFSEERKIVNLGDMTNAGGTEVVLALRVRLCDRLVRSRVVEPMTTSWP